MKMIIIYRKNYLLVINNINIFLIKLVIINHKIIKINKEKNNINNVWVNIKKSIILIISLQNILAIYYGE